MKKLLGALGILIAALTLSALAQGPGRLSPDDQREFDKYYTKWVNDTRRNDRDDIAKDVGHMQEIMNRNHISADVSFDRIASTGNAYAVDDNRGRLSTDEQREFDKYYTKWVNDTLAEQHSCQCSLRPDRVTRCRSLPPESLALTPEVHRHAPPFFSAISQKVDPMIRLENNRSSLPRMNAVLS